LRRPTTRQRRLACDPMLANLSLFVATLVLLYLILYVRLRRRLRSYDPALAAPISLASTSPPTAVTRYLEQREAKAAPLMPGAESCVHWAEGLKGKRAPICIVFLHGWSAGLLEIDPVDAHVSKALGAHLLRFRLSGHGVLPPERAFAGFLDAASRAALQRDAATAFALAKLLGERVVFIGSSTGATLAVWLASLPFAAPELAALALISPGFTIAKYGKRLYNTIKWPIQLLPSRVCRWLLHKIGGPVHLVRHLNEEHANVWLHSYPTYAYLTLIELYTAVEVRLARATISIPVIAFANPADRVIDFDDSRTKLASMRSAQLVVVDDSENNHVITGRILSPSTVERIQEHMTAFLRTVLQQPGAPQQPDASRRPLRPQPARSPARRRAAPG